MDLRPRLLARRAAGLLTVSWLIEFRLTWPPVKRLYGRFGVSCPAVASGWTIRAGSLESSDEYSTNGPSDRKSRSLRIRIEKSHD